MRNRPSAAGRRDDTRHHVFVARIDLAAGARYNRRRGHRRGARPAMRLLVIEDSPKMANLLRRGLSEEGYAVDVASTGVDGVWLATEISFDANALDVQLADLDGVEVCRQLRAAGRCAPPPGPTARDDDT